MDELPFDVLNILDGKSVDDASLSVDYTNYKKERAVRRVIPLGFRFGSSMPWHPHNGWILKVWDLEKSDYRDYSFDKNTFHSDYSLFFNSPDIATGIFIDSNSGMKKEYKIKHIVV